MKAESWTRYLVAAALVLLAGAVWALAEDIEMKVEVRSEGGQEMTIDVNGIKEIVALEDLADGEERVYDVGGHEVTVQRIGDHLTLVGDGPVMGFAHDCDHKKVWIGDDAEGAKGGRHVFIMKHGEGETVDLDLETDLMFVGDGGHGVRKIVVINGEDGKVDLEALKEKYGDDFEEYETADGAHVMKWVSAGGGADPIIIKRMGHRGGDFVTYRCEDTGSILTVKAADDLLDDYIDPVTGCVMKKVENAGVHVIKIREEIVTEDEDQ